MSYEEVLRYIAETGYRTAGDLKVKFKDSNQEILEAILEFLVSKRKVGVIKYSVPITGRTEGLYYIP